MDNTQIQKSLSPELEEYLFDEKEWETVFYGALEKKRAEYRKELELQQSSHFCPECGHKK